MAACCPLLPSGINDEGLLRVRFGPFAKPSVYDRYVREADKPDEPRRAPGEASVGSGALPRGVLDDLQPHRRRRVVRCRAQRGMQMTYLIYCAGAEVLLHGAATSADAPAAGA